jgi:hypothetical protein
MSPSSRKVASPWEKQEPLLGQRASSQTVRSERAASSAAVPEAALPRSCALFFLAASTIHVGNVIFIYVYSVG